MSLLEVRDLVVGFRTRRGVVQAVNGVSYTVDAGDTLAVVGESGSGKSVAALALMGLLPTPPASISGSARLGGEELIGAPASRLQAIRGNDLAMVFQDPMTSLNPVLPIGLQLTEHVVHHLGASQRQARDRAVELLTRVGLPGAGRRLDDYPHQLSGGMRQRVMIAIALACDPKVLIADEPTTALDVTIQAQIVELVNELQRENGMAVIWITHDLGVVAGLADRVVVMYAGQVLEEAGVDALYATPLHPYTTGLLGSLPVLGAQPETLSAIPGLPPDPTDLPEGCVFWPRCHVRADPRCEHERPPLREVRPGHRVAAFYSAPGAAPPGEPPALGEPADGR